MKSKHEDTRQHLLQVGYELLTTKGFTATGLSELLTLAQVPRGSFYHYFKSKEAYGVALIEAYFERYLAEITPIFSAQSSTGYDRLVRYFSLWYHHEDDYCHASRCLVVKLAAEVSDLSDAMRKSLLSGVNSVVSEIASCIEVGVSDGSIPACDSQLQAQALYQLWIGSGLLYRLVHDNSTLERSMALTRQLLRGDGG